MSPVAVDVEMMRAMPMLLGFDAREWARDLRLPTLVIAGGQDPIVPMARARAVHEAIPGSVFAVVEGAGHVPTSERREAVGPIVRRFVVANGVQCA